MRRIYLKRKNLEEAKGLFLDAFDFDNLAVEKVRSINSLFRITARKVLSKRFVPEFTSAAMDGIMVDYKHTLGATIEDPKKIVDFQWINTGKPIKDPYNSVIMIEDLLEQDDGSIIIRKSYSPWENIRLVGEDYSIQDLVLPSNHKIMPEDITTLLDTGNDFVWVYRKLKVAIIPTGDELVTNASELHEGKVLETNSYMYKNYLDMWGCDSHVFNIVKDSKDELSELLSTISPQYDMIITIAGSSAGSKDFTAEVLTKLGELIVHGVNVRPGKPLILGKLYSKPFIGLPGYPAAGYTDFMLFVKPIVEKLYHIEKFDNSINAYVGKSIFSNYSVDEQIRVIVGKVKGRYVLSTIKRGSAPTKPLVESDGYIMSPKGNEGINEGETVKVFLNGKYNIDKNIIFIGSNDLLIDIIRDELSKKGYNLKVSNQGSMAAIKARSKDLSHIGGLHLLNPLDGQYNDYYVNKFLSKDYILMNLSYRMQGLLTLKENPKNINKIEDITKCLFINRQMGSGTRVLLDYLLDKYKIDKFSIQGYSNIEFTHSGVCTRIINHNADCGLAIYATSKIFDLNFIPIAEERYDLLIEKSFYNSKIFELIYEIINSEKFKTTVEDLGGYNLKDCGKLILSK